MKSSPTLETIQKEILKAEINLNKYSSFSGEHLSEKHNTNTTTLLLEDDDIPSSSMMCFRPHLPQTSKHIVAGMENRHFPPHQRLYEEAKLKDDQLINMKKHLDRIRVQTDLTHRPRLNGNCFASTTPTSALRPLHERIPDILKERDLTRRIEEKTDIIERARLASSNFNNNYSSYVSSSSHNNDPFELLDVSTRLLLRGKLMKERRTQRIQEADERLSQTIHPIPTLSSHKFTDSLISLRNPILRANFEDRQAIYASQGEARKLIQSQNTDEDEKLFFMPSTNTKSAFILASGRPRLLTENREEKFIRLSKTEPEHIQEKKQQFAKEIQKLECTFAPTINVSSRRLASDHCFEDLVKDSRGRQARQKIAERRQEEIRQSCTFTPNLCRGTTQMMNNSERERDGDVSLSLLRGTFIDPALLNVSTGIFRKPSVENKDEGESSLVECTFHPRVFPYRDRICKEPILVNGLSRHLQLRYMAVQKVQYVEERKRRVFYPNNSQFRDLENITIVEPFNLTQPRFHSKSKLI